MPFQAGLDEVNTQFYALLTRVNRLLSATGATPTMMLSFKFLVVLLGPTGLSDCIPLASAELAQTLDIRQSNGTFPIIGVPGLTYPRLEIRQMLNEKPNQWNLYLLAMQEFQAQNQSAQLSYYQIAGIHGLPNVPWDGVQANPASGGAVGYCTHSSVLFPAWHRAYLALFEQEFMQVVQSVAESFPEPARTVYLGAASSMRIPYWDWAAAPNNSLPTFPNVIAQKYVAVNTPTGQETILNPLFRYTFHPLDTSSFIYNPWNTWGQTLRYPTSMAENATSQDNLVQAAIENNRINIRNNAYNMFTMCSDYMEFSNDASSSSTPGCSTSLEAIHDSIHSLVGGSNDGHMTWLWWAAFDPVFFLHHAYVI